MNKLHPNTLKSLAKGHPWVTRDEYSAKLPKQKTLLPLYGHGKNQFFGYFLHDPDHPKVVARFWSLKNESFEKLFITRLNKAIVTRKLGKFNRENIVLVFGEKDELPGLFIHKYKNSYLIQSNTKLWKNSIKAICQQLKSHFGDDCQIWYQERNISNLKEGPREITPQNEQEIFVKEFGISYLVKFNLNHDPGLYNDMASIRSNLTKYFERGKSLLNLFSYTGSFSLLGHKAKMSVTSVDTSKTYMDWYIRNLESNGFNFASDIRAVKSVISFIDLSLEAKKNYDLIICDPPSSFIHKKKKWSSLDFYKKYIKKLFSLLAKNGKMIVFINTHSVSEKKFKNAVLSSLDKNKYQLLEKYELGEDCTPLPSFQEGAYLKGLCIKKT